ncbi:1240_t:CDS:2 [Paraglomus brasilianum]|uniref:1240_t:CDS:1 n=1 Tax=Paraglomus brasilianum TaxID=144538 RepID=A0A9N9BMT5_9GLOM|nr:1240_t:CDS:2 [Paraglomus brasilianum]
MSKVATNFVNQYNLTPQMSIAELGFSKDQTYALIPIQASGRRVTGRNQQKSYYTT